MRDYPGDINLSTDGHWHALIQRVQPLISDAGFRVTSEERYRPRDGVYAVHHHGPLGDKQVIRTPAGITVYYNDVRETDPAKLRATGTGDNILLLKTNMGAGHGGKSGRFAALEEQAEEYAFILAQFGLAGPR